MLEIIRKSLLEEARYSPALLSDLAGLEHYIAESYDARSLVELLQNADDAGASRFAIQRVRDFLFVANDGRPFTASDFESLCRSAASSKSRGNSIGYRGIGFKSVVGFAKTVHLFSGPLEATFSRERTAQEIPQATRVPLIRIPHPVDPIDRSSFAGVIERMMSDGFNSVFIFADLVARGIEAEFSAFDPTSLLFLRHIKQVELQADVEAIITARRETVDTRTQTIRLTSAEGVKLWTVVTRDKISLAFAHGETAIQRLDERESVVHAFLPTMEPTGLPIKINGDISTDPSRTRIVLDDRTADGIHQTAALIVDLIEEVLSGNAPLINEGILSALIPLSDPRMAGFQRRSFKTDLLTAIQNAAAGRFNNLRYHPAWLNSVDFEKAANAVKMRVVPRRFENIEGLSSFLKFLGAKEASLEELSPALKNTVPSITGAAELVSYITNRYATKQVSADSIKTEWPLWPVNGVPRALSEVQKSKDCLDRDFTDLVTEKIGAGTQLQRLVSDLTDSETAATMLSHTIASTVPSAETTTASKPAQSTNASNPTSTQQLSLKRWRSAEQQVLTLLDTLGWAVEDVSRQNIGYDIEGRTPEGVEVFIEVKSIDNPGQAFTLTSNEEAVARQKGNSYRIAIVRQTNSHLEVAFIQDPANQLHLTRQCRQWVWECGTYDFNPERFNLE